MKSVKTLQRLLVHPKDKQEKEEIMWLGYCEKTYTGETEKKFGKILKEDKTDVEAFETPERR